MFRNPFDQFFTNNRDLNFLIEKIKTSFDLTAGAINDLRERIAGAKGGGLSQAQVDARVRALVEDWALRENPKLAIPRSKLVHAPCEPHVHDPGGCPPVTTLPDAASLKDGQCVTLLREYFGKKPSLSNIRISATFMPYKIPPPSAQTDQLSRAASVAGGPAWGQIGENPARYGRVASSGGKIDGGRGIVSGIVADAARFRSNCGSSLAECAPRAYPTGFHVTFSQAIRRYIAAGNQIYLDGYMYPSFPGDESDTTNRYRINSLVISVHVSESPSYARSYITFRSVPSQFEDWGGRAYPGNYNTWVATIGKAAFIFNIKKSDGTNPDISDLTGDRYPAGVYVKREGILQPISE